MHNCSMRSDFEIIHRNQYQKKAERGMKRQNVDETKNRWDTNSDKKNNTVEKITKLKRVS